MRDVRSGSGHVVGGLALLLVAGGVSAGAAWAQTRDADVVVPVDALVALGRHLGEGGTARVTVDAADYVVYRSYTRGVCWMHAATPGDFVCEDPEDIS